MYLEYIVVVPNFMGKKYGFETREKVRSIVYLSNVTLCHLLRISIQCTVCDDMRRSVYSCF